MSSTRHAPADGFIRQERYASSEAYKTSLGGLLVAKRVGVLKQDAELAELIWMIQEQSLPDPYSAGGRSGSVEATAAALLDQSGYTPDKIEVIEVWDGRGQSVNDEWKTLSASEVTDRRVQAVHKLANALRRLALDPAAVPTELPHLGKAWRRELLAYRERYRAGVKQGLAPTSVTKQAIKALKFSRETGKLSLTVGRARLGKSAAAKGFCAGSCGMARYVLTPEDGDMDSFYRAIAKSLGVADSLSRKASDVRDMIERMLVSSRLMLVFDEAHNLFSGLRRVTRLPQRVLFLRRLIDARVPLAFVSLPEFRVRVQRCVEQLEWDAAQITDLVCREEVLPDRLNASDFEVLLERLAPELSDKSKAMIAGSARNQHGAQYIVDTVAVAKHEATKAGRSHPSDEDVRVAVDGRPHFLNEAPDRRPKKGKKAPPAAPAPERLALPAAALSAHGGRIAGAMAAQVPVSA